MSSYKQVDLHRKKSDVLVIHCADPRFQRAYRQAIDDLGVYFDLLAVPGASKAVADNPSTTNYIKLLHDFHDFETIHIMDHIECGAFGQIEDELKDHTASLKAASAKIKQDLPEIMIVAHLLGERQELPVEL